MRFPISVPAISVGNLCNRVKELSSIGKWKDVVLYYREIRRAGVELQDCTTLPHILRACLSLSFPLGESVHASLIKQGFSSFALVGNSLTDFYVKSGELDAAAHAFDAILTKDSVSWNIILHAHLSQGAPMEGLGLFVQAREFGFEPNVSTLVLILQTYRNLKAFDDSQTFHGYLIRSGLCWVLSVQNSLLGLYMNIRMDYAEALFNEMHERDVITWSVMIGGYMHSDEVILAIEMFKCMASGHGIEPDGQTMVSVLKGCAKLADIKIGKSVHGFVMTRGLDYDMFVGNTLVDLYCRCGDIKSAVMAFHEMPCKNVVTWNSMLSGYVHSRNYAEALVLLDSMGKAGVLADEVTLVNLLVICKAIGDLHRCRSIHCRVIRSGFQSNEMVMNSLIDAYVKCDRLDLSWRVFCIIDVLDVVTWSTMISGFTYCGMPDQAISLYREMQLTQLNQNPVVLLSLLEACALSAEIVRSKWAHGIAIKMGLALDVAVGTTIVNMYAKCGAMEASRKAFDQIPHKNIVSWSTMIDAYGLNGLPHDALHTFSEMEAHGLKPNSVTILSVLSACCHGGLVDEGISLFKDAANKYGDEEMKVEHYSCLVDLLARAGKLDEAVEVIKSKHLGASAWGAVLSACRSYEDRKLMIVTLSRVLELEPLSSAGYILASNVYANGGLWKDASALRCLMKEQGVKVMAGYSIVHVNSRAYTFTAGDRCHSFSRMVCPIVQQLHLCMQPQSLTPI